MAKIELCWGGGSFDVLLDLRSRSMELIPYQSVGSAASVHQKFGGRNYYQSRSGLSGAGWIPAHLYLKRVQVYRMDTRYPSGSDLVNDPDTLPGIRIVVPIDYRRGQVSHDWPIITHGNSWNTCRPDFGPALHALEGRYDLEDLLLHGEKNFERTNFEVRYFSSPQGREETHTFEVGARGGHLPRNAKRVLIALMRSCLAFQTQPEEWSQMNATSLFWHRLGLHRLGDQLFKLANGICWGRYSLAELSTSVEALQAASPANVVFLTPSLYIQEEEERARYVLVGRTVTDGEETTVETEITVAEAIQAIRGVVVGLTEKVETLAKQRREQLNEAVEPFEEGRYTALFGSAAGEEH